MSCLNHIYAVKHLQQLLFGWKHSPTTIGTDHWMVLVKYAPKDAPHIGKGRWSWPRALLEDENLIKRLVVRGTILQTDIENWRKDNMNQN